MNNNPILLIFDWIGKIDIAGELSSIPETLNIMVSQKNSFMPITDQKLYLIFLLGDFNLNIMF